MTASRSRITRYFGPLWKNRDFCLLWGSLTITHFGGQITFLALPLTAALLLNATPFEMGVLVALETLPYTLFGLFTGVLVDRSRKLPIIITADIGRGLALLAIPLAAWLNLLTMPLLYIVGFLVGAGSIVGWAAYQVFMTERVGRENLLEANSKIALSDSSAQLIGPGLAGMLIQWLTAPFAILLDAFSFFASAWMLRNIPSAKTDTPKMSGTPSSLWQDIREGLALIWTNRILRSIAWGLGLWQLLKHMFIATVILYGTRELELSAGQIGIIFTMGGIGCLLASFSVSRLNHMAGVGVTMLGGLFLTACAWLLIAATQKGLWARPGFGAAIFILDFGAMLFFINYLSLRQSVTPDALLGRVTSTMIFITISFAPLGSLLGGALAEIMGLRMTIATAGIGGVLLTSLLMYCSPLAKMHVLPRPAPYSASTTEILPK